MITAIKLTITVLLMPVGFVIHSVMDLAILAIACLCKGLRLLYLGIHHLIWDDETYELTRQWSWSAVNMGYKTLVDKLYPTEEEES